MKRSNLLLFAATLILCAGVIEVFSRILISTDRFKNASTTKYLNQRSIDKNPSVSNNQFQKQVPNPYILYRNNPNYLNPETLIKEYDSNGYRNPEYNSDKDCFKILALGGSTTNEDPYVTRSQSWTMVLNRLLNDNSKGNTCYQVFNAGLGWGTSAELLTEFLFNGIYIDPDLVIVHTGGNDGLALRQKEYKTDYSHIRARGNINSGLMYFLSSTTLGKNIHKLSQASATVKLALIFLMNIEGGVTTFTPAINGVFPLPPEESLDIVRSREPVAFKNNVTNIVRIAKSRNSRVLLVPFIQAPKDQLTSHRPSWRGQEETMIQSVKKHRDALKEISTDEMVNFYEFNKSSFKDEWFVDNCHLNEKGSNEKALQIYRYIKSSGLERK